MIDAVVDLSHWNVAPDFAAMKAGGTLGVILKATQGTGYLDATFMPRAMAAIASGLLVGAYHFCDASAPAEQAAFFLSVAGLAPVLALDVEPNSIPGGTVSVAQAAEIAGRVQMITGRAPLIYIGRWGPDGRSGGLPNAVLAQCPLWVPAYHADPADLTLPTLPPGWTKFLLWQYTDTPDRSRFAGTADELRTWWQPGLAHGCDAD